MRMMLVPGLLLLFAVRLSAQGTPVAPAPPAGPLHWGPAPAVFPPGAKMAVVSGDPSKAGSFTIQLAMPDGYRIPPHFHPTDEAVEVKQGATVVVVTAVGPFAMTYVKQP
jgi:hypothetical protein